MTSRDLGEEFGRVRLRHEGWRQVEGRLRAEGDNAEGRTRGQLSDEEEERVLDDFPVDGLAAVVLVADQPVDDENDMGFGRRAEREHGWLERSRFVVFFVR